MKKKVIVITPAYVPGHGSVPAGERTLPEEVARLLVERGFAVEPEEGNGEKKGKKGGK